MKESLIFKPKVDWLKDQSIIYIDYNHYLDKMNIFYKYKTEESDYEIEFGKDFKPFIYISDEGSDNFNVLNHSTYFKNIKSMKKARGDNAYMASAETQFLIQTKKNYFENMLMGDLKIMVFDIETTSLDPKYGEILAIGLKSNYDFSDGSRKRIIKSDGDEKKLLLDFIDFVVEENPDVMSGHNIFSFDIPYIETRMLKNKVVPALGRFKKSMYKSFMTTRVSRLIKGNEFFQYKIPGRYLVDTMHLAMIEDTRRNEFESYGLKYLAQELGVAPEDRVYLEGDDIHNVFYDDYEAFEKYLTDDLDETMGLLKIFLPSYFAACKKIPINLQDIIYTGATRKAMSLFLYDYYHNEKPLPKPRQKEKFEGAISRAQEHGVYYNVHKYDVSSLYPSIMMNFGYYPESDTLGVFEKYLKEFTTDRLKFKKLMQEEEDKIEKGEGNDLLREEYSAYQLFAKIFINSFYGILGNEFFNFNDYKMAAAVTSKGREILLKMLDVIEASGCTILSLDTDGIYFSAPDELDPIKLLGVVNENMTTGIKVEFEKSFKAMFSYKGKTYAALHYDEDKPILVKGSAFKGRGKPPFIRKFLKRSLKHILTKNLKDYTSELTFLKKLIASKTLKLEEVIEKKTISYNYKTYISRARGGIMGHFEAMAREGVENEFKAGNKVAFYFAGDTYNKKTKKSDICKLYYEENTDIDYNSDYYLEMVMKWEKSFAEFINNIKT